MLKPCSRAQSFDAGREPGITIAYSGIASPLSSWRSLTRFQGTIDAKFCEYHLSPDVRSNLFNLAEYRRSTFLRRCECEDCGVEYGPDTGNCTVSDVQWRTLFRELANRDVALRHLELTGANVGSFTLKLLVRLFGGDLRVVRLDDGLDGFGVDGDGFD